ncbi:hypothetical protein IJT17_05145 [bacterium]|nr:hypothetical protein [bacterium]
MDNISSLRLALCGSNRLILTLGLMLARRDLRLMGIAPSMPDTAASADAVPDAVVRVLHSTLLLGCPVYTEPRELLQQCDLAIADAGMYRALSGMSDKPIAMIEHADDAFCEGYEAVCPSFTAVCSDDSWLCSLRFSSEDAEALMAMRKLWDSLKPSKERGSDACLLSWKQASDLIELLFSEGLTA